MTPAEVLNVIEIRTKQADKDRIILAYNIASFISEVFVGELKDLRHYIPDLRVPQGYHRRAIETAEKKGLRTK